MADSPPFRIIQDKKSRKYFAGGDRWVNAVAETKHFPSLSDATEAAAKLPTGCCVLVLRFNERSEFDVILEL